MAVNEIHVGDVGTQFIVTIYDDDDVVVDISAATTKNIIFKKADGSLLTKAASFVTSGADGKIQYTTVAGDLDIYGNWSVQAFIDFGSTEWYSDIQKFKVYKNLGAC